MSPLGIFSIDDGEGNDNATNKQFDWSSEENKCAARVARTYEKLKLTSFRLNKFRLQNP